MVDFQIRDVLHLPLLGGGLPVVGIAIQAPLVLAALVTVLAVQVHFCEYRSSHVMIVLLCPVDP